MSSPSYTYAIAPGDTITVVFDGTTADLTCDYQRLADNGNTVIVTTPPDASPETAVVNYIDDFQYFYKGIGPAQINLGAGEVVEVVISVRANNGTVTNSITGTIVAVDYDLGILEIDDGTDVHVVRNWLYFTRL